MQNESREPTALEIVGAVETAAQNIVEVVKILAASSDDDDAVERLSARFGFSRPLAQAVCDAQLSQLNGRRRRQRQSWLAENALGEDFSG